MNENTYKITFLPDNVTVEVAAGSTIMDAERDAELSFEYPCGGNGTCGKCLVGITCHGEYKRVKSCTTKVYEDCTVDLSLSQKDENEHVLTDSVKVTSKNRIPAEPYIKVFRVTIPEAKIGDARSDFERLSAICTLEFGLTDITYNSLSVLSALSSTLAKDIFTVNAVFYGNILLDIRTDDVEPLGLSFDIGTTTIACYLTDLYSGKEVASTGALNEQVKYGNDVISRCIFATSTSLDEISTCVNKQTENLAKALLKSIDKKPEDVYFVSVVGNTAMHHIFAGISPASLLNAPYTPSYSRHIIMNAATKLSDAVNKNAKLLFLPVIAGFIGADTVSAMISSDFSDKSKPTLLIDIGTNGEMALGNATRWVACSTASGPAFEGAKITCGMRGARGAIDHVNVKDGKLSYSVIDAAKPRGICGSGLVDAIALMLNEKIISQSGRFNKAPIDGNDELFKRVAVISESKCFILATAEESDTGEPVYITQKDIREVQLAKGAIAAGIEIMTETIGITYDDINEVLIAGAFGNYMRAESMCEIGMIPNDLLSKIVPIGNAAGTGAKLCAINKSELLKAEYISKKTEFIELATHDMFQSKFISQLDFKEV